MDVLLARRVRYIGAGAAFFQVGLVAADFAFPKIMLFFVQKFARAMAEQKVELTLVETQRLAEQPGKIFRSLLKVPCRKSFENEALR